MDPQDDVFIATVEAALEDLVHIAIVMAEAALERERQKKREMEQSLSAQQAALQEKEREREMLMAKKKEMLAEEAANEKLADDLMFFIEAENNDPEIGSGDGDKNGGSGGGDNVSKNNLGSEEKAIKDAIIAMINSDGNCGGNNGGFAAGNGGINDVPENAQNLDDQVMVAANKGKNSDGSEE